MDKIKNDNSDLSTVPSELLGVSDIWLSDFVHKTKWPTKSTILYSYSFKNPKLSN